MESIKKHAVAIGIAAGAAVAAGAFFLFKSKSKDDEDYQITDETGTVLTKSEIDELISSIKVERQGGILTLSSIEQIFNTTLKLALPAFRKLTYKDRTERRANRDSLSKYCQLWDNFSQSLENVIESSQKEILKGLGISNQEWETSNTTYMESGNYRFMMLIASLPQKLKMSLISDKVLSLEEFKSVLRAQVKYLREETANAQEISVYITRQEELAPIIQNRVNDLIYDEFNVEEEDVFGSMKSHIANPEVQQIFMELQQATQGLMPAGMGEGMF